MSQKLEPLNPISVICTPKWSFQNLRSKKTATVKFFIIKRQYGIKI